MGVFFLFFRGALPQAPKARLLRHDACEFKSDALPRRRPGCGSRLSAVDDDALGLPPEFENVQPGLARRGRELDAPLLLTAPESIACLVRLGARAVRRRNVSGHGIGAEIDEARIAVVEESAPGTLRT